jgi:hypothetical protein
MDIYTFYEKLKAKQNNSQKWNSIINDIIEVYTYNFTPSEQLCTVEELWDFVFTSREDHLIFHKKIWDLFSNMKYNRFFIFMYTAMDDPDSKWWILNLKL